MATINLAVVDLVASVGLWQRVAWGNVLWVYAALFEVAMHTVFIGDLRQRPPIVAFHVVTVAVYLAIAFLARRAEQTDSNIAHKPLILMHFPAIYHQTRYKSVSRD